MADESKVAQPSASSPKEKNIDTLDTFIRVLFGFLVVLIITTFIVRLIILSNHSYKLENSKIKNINIVLERAQDAVDSADLILSFIEGASVLVALSLGAAALYGYRSLREQEQKTSELQKQFDSQLKELDNSRNELITKFNEESKTLEEAQTTQITNTIDPLTKDVQAMLQRVDEKLSQITALYEKIEPNEETLATLKPFLDSMQNQFKNSQEELLPNLTSLFGSILEINLKNYHVAYESALRVLNVLPNTSQALYIAGWLELQYIEHDDDIIDSGVERLKKALELEPDSPSIKAAYGVGLRRQGRKLSEGSNQRLTTLLQALLYMYDAVKEPNHNLLDLNGESFWGPIGGTERDLGNLHKALDAYGKAYNITPRSSYPLGNMAELYLKLRNENPGYIQEAINCFHKTIKRAKQELGTNPTDYFPKMDLAMAHTMLGDADPWVDDSQQEHNLNLGEEHLQEIFEMGGSVTSNLLDVSLGGWKRLQEACPDEWENVKDRITSAISRIEAKIEELKKQADTGSTS